MTSSYRPDNILCMRVSPTGPGGGMNVLTLFRDGTPAQLFEGEGEKADIAQKLVWAFQVTQPTQLFIENTRGDYVVAGPGYSEEFADQVLHDTFPDLAEEEEGEEDQPDPEYDELDFTFEPEAFEVGEIAAENDLTGYF